MFICGRPVSQPWQVSEQQQQPHNANIRCVEHIFVAACSVPRYPSVLQVAYGHFRACESRCCWFVLLHGRVASTTGSGRRDTHGTASLHFTHNTCRCWSLAKSYVLDPVHERQQCFLCVSTVPGARQVHLVACCRGGVGACLPAHGVSLLGGMQVAARVVLWCG
jgi:hypothetical protein